MTKIEALVGINQEIRRLENSKKVNHILHLLLTILTGGLWIFVWIFILLTKVELTPSAKSKMLEELYALREEAELKLKMYKR